MDFKELNEEIQRLTSLRQKQLEVQHKDLMEEFLKLEWLKEVTYQDPVYCGAKYSLVGFIPDKYRCLFSVNTCIHLFGDNKLSNYNVFISRPWGSSGLYSFEIYSESPKTLTEFIKKCDLKVSCSSYLKDRILLYQTVLEHDKK